MSGALIGLLFVAISVAPERMHRRDDSSFKIRAGIAFASLTNCLLITLIALVPDAGLGSAAIFFAAGGLVSSLWLAWVAAHERALGARLWALARIALLAALFCVQLVNGTWLQDRPHSSGALATISYLVLAGFAMAIERSWELVGASGTSLLAQLERVSSATHAAVADRDESPPEDPGDDGP